MSTALSGEEARLLRRLADESAVRGLIRGYTSAVDWMNWPALERLFWPDASIDFGLFKGPRDEFLRFVADLEPRYTRRLHLFGGERIALVDAEADAEVGCVSHVRSVDEQGTRDEFVWGRYLFKLDRRGAAWRISAMTYLLNVSELFQTPAGEEVPLNKAEGMSPEHPLMPRF